MFDSLFYEFSSINIAFFLEKQGFKPCFGYWQFRLQIYSIYHHKWQIIFMVVLLIFLHQFVLYLTHACSCLKIWKMQKSRTVTTHCPLICFSNIYLTLYPALAPQQPFRGRGWPEGTRGPTEEMSTQAGISKRNSRKWQEHRARCAGRRKVSTEGNLQTGSSQLFLVVVVVFVCPLWFIKRRESNRCFD